MIIKKIHKKKLKEPIDIQLNGLTILCGDNKTGKSDIINQIQKLSIDKGLLIFDDLAMSVHPKNQIATARYIAKLVNEGNKVLLSTYSDFIIKEFNILIMFNQNKPYLKKIIDKYGYKKNELLSIDKITAYETYYNNGIYEIIPANIKQDLGIEIKSFDEIINRMNKIQDAIIYGE
jgi:predicted ATPase